LKAQSALEFMTVVALGLILISIASFFGVDYITSYFTDINSINARQTIESLVSAINLVYAQGVGAQTKVFVTLPNGIQRSNSYISGNQINIRFSDGVERDVFRTTNLRVLGTLPLNPGRTPMIVKMESIGAVIGIAEHDVCFIYALTYSDSSYNNIEDNFSVGSTVYYLIYLEDVNGNSVDSNLNIKIYNPQREVFIDFNTSTTNGYYNGSFVPNAAGDWLISALNIDTNVVGTALINVT